MFVRQCPAASTSKCKSDTIGTIPSFVPEPSRTAFRYLLGLAGSEFRALFNEEDNDSDAGTPISEGGEGPESNDDDTEGPGNQVVPLGIQGGRVSRNRRSRQSRRQ